MTTIVLERFNYSSTETEGILSVQGRSFYTLEKPWVPGPLGGKPFESCIPDGEYRLTPHKRPNGRTVLALVNPNLGVYRTKDDKGDRDGRYLILIHAANFTEEVMGCIAPGHSRIIYRNKRMVTSSRSAMRLIMQAKPTRLVIRPSLSTGTL